MAQRDDISGLDTLDALAREAERVAGSAAPVAVETLPSVATTHYEIVGEQGRGGMGRVLVALDKRLGRPVALKELLSSKPEATARFVREALVTARLQHPSIVPVHEAGRWPGGEPFYAMKLVQGKPLDALVRSAGNFSARLALLPMVIAVAEAVAYAHSRRVIHRDLKPANVVVGEFGETILLDWGLAKELGPDQESVEPSAPAHAEPGQTLDGSVVGTPGFMSPEQAAGGAVDIRTDVYALGALLYNVLTGELPLRGRGALELLQQSVDGKIVPVREREPRVPDEIVDILQKSMARRPQDRYASARELADDLKRFQTGQLVAAHRYSTGELVGRWLKRHRVAVATATVALALVSASAVVSVRRVVRERDRAETAQAQAELARLKEAERVDELMVVNARAVLDHDPTGALAWLKRLRPGSARWPAAALVAADAQKRGVAERHFVAHKGGALALTVSPDGKWLASGGADGVVRVASLVGGGCTVLGPVAGEITALQFLPDDQRLLAATSGGRLQLWELKTRAALVLEGHHGRIGALALSTDGKRAVSGGADGQLRVWDLSVGESRGVFDMGRPITSVALSLDGKRVAARASGTVRSFDATSLSPISTAPEPGDGALVFTADGTLAAGGVGEVRLWNPAGHARALPLGGSAIHVAVSPDGRRLAATSDDGSVVWWELDAPAPHPLAHRGDASRDIAFSRDGTRIGSTRGDTVRVWFLPGADPRKLRGPSLEVTRLEFSPDGGRVVACALDGGVWIFRLGAGLLPAEPEPPEKEQPLRAWLDTVTDAVVSD